MSTIQHSEESLMIRMCQLKMFFNIFHSSTAGSWELPFSDGIA